MIVLGIDPGLAALGWGVIQFTRGVPAYLAHGVVTTEPGGEEWARARVQMRAVQRLAMEHQANAIGAEAWNYYTKQVTTASHQLGLVIGGIIGVSTVPVVSAGTASEWRRSLGLPHQCSKPDVQKFVQQRLGMAKIPRPQHASDALAVALAVFPKL